MGNGVSDDNDADDWRFLMVQSCFIHLAYVIIMIHLS